MKRLFLIECAAGLLAIAFAYLIAKTLPLCEL